MNQSNTNPNDDLSIESRNDSQRAASAASWGAIVAGATAAAALSLILLMLGTGLGLSSVSPWVNDGVSATTFGVSTILWIMFTQILASGLGGYLAGRLRNRWLLTDTDEVYFRDTAHGFLAWAVASLATATLLTSVIGSIVSGGVQVGASIAGGAAAGGAIAASSAMANAGGDGASMGYFVDRLFRDASGVTAATAATDGVTAETVTEQSATAAAAEVSRIFMNTPRTGSMAAEDVRHVGQMIAQRTDLTQQEAEARVTETYAAMQAKWRAAAAAAKEAADKARKASAHAALWLFISLLIGAFVASLAATFGGRQRDL